jgi:plastocyanin domain-containing protein
VTPAVGWTADRIAAVAGGAALGVFLWLFFFGRRNGTVAARPSEGGAQRVEIAVQGGYSPDLIVARRGIPLTLVFDRRESNPCSDEVVLPEFGIRRALPAFGKTEIEVLPQRIGEFPFSCGMNMLHGKIRVVES